MCIAIGSPIGVDIPSEDILKNCWNNNDDGAGFAYNLDGRVIIRKGYMTYEAFSAALKQHNETYNLKNRGVLIHFRIATHGGVLPAMTHPFPIVADNGALSKIQYSSDYAVIHNGVISLTSYDATKEKATSDTAVFIRDYLSSLATNKNWFDNDANIELIHKLIGSKMAILNKKGEIKMTAGFTADNGNFYSNDSYLYNYYTYNRTNNVYVYQPWDEYEYDIAEGAYYNSSRNYTPKKKVLRTARHGYRCLYKCSR